MVVVQPIVVRYVVGAAAGVGVGPGVGMGVGLDDVVPDGGGVLLDVIFDELPHAISSEQTSSNTAASETRMGTSLGDEGLDTLLRDGAAFARTLSTGCR